MEAVLPPLHLALLLTVLYLHSSFPHTLRQGHCAAMAEAESSEDARKRIMNEKRLAGEFVMHASCDGIRKVSITILKQPMESRLAGSANND